MGIQRRPPATRFLLVAALVLASAGVAGAPVAGSAGADPGGRWAVSAARPGGEAAVLADRATVLRAPVDRPGRGGPLPPLLLSLPAAALGAAAAVRALGSPWRRAPARPLPGRSRVDARAPPPLLQPV
jgi:hypothetical protein